MTPKDVFSLVVRLSGYFTTFFAVYLIIGMLLGPGKVDIGAFFKFIWRPGVYGVLGIVIIRAAPKIAGFAYPGT